MKKFFQTIKNIFSIEDLRLRIINTIGYLLIFRLVSYIVLPGINADVVASQLEKADKTGLLGLINTFSGGAFKEFCV